jgi:5-methylthioadenosine/S-adenosylhomocysteine deaminase
MVHLNANDLSRAARGGISVVHCPQSNLKLGNGISPTPAMHALGINLGLGTAGAAANNDLNLLDEMRTAALLATGATPRVDGVAVMSAHDWLRIATLGSARALGLSDAIGSLAPGKWADLCCIDLARPHSQPVYDVAAAVVHSVSRDQVSDVWVAGRALVANGQLMHFDTADLLRRAERWRERIAPTRQD